MAAAAAAAIHVYPRAAAAAIYPRAAAAAIALKFHPKLQQVRNNKTDIKKWEGGGKSAHVHAITSVTSGQFLFRSLTHR